MVLRNTGVRTALFVEDRNLQDQDAAVTLAGIAAGTLGRSLLLWIPLMHGGGVVGIIQQWLELARQETDSRRRSDYGGLALVFAEASGRPPVWKEALKGWNMRDSQQVLEWIAMGRSEGKIEGERDALLRLLEKRFSPGAPAEVISAIRGTEDLEQLRHWVDSACSADSLDASRQAAGL